MKITYKTPGGKTRSDITIEATKEEAELSFKEDFPMCEVV